LEHQTPRPLLTGLATPDRSPYCLNKRTHFFSGKLSKLPRSQAIELDRPHRDPPKAANPMTDPLERAADLAVDALVEHHLEPSPSSRRFAHPPNLGGKAAAAPKVNAAPSQHIQMGLIGKTFYGYPIPLGQHTRVHPVLGKPRVVYKEQKPLRVLVQPPDGVPTLVGLREPLEERRAPPLSNPRDHDFPRLVHGHHAGKAQERSHERTIVTQESAPPDPGSRLSRYGGIGV
jgi:hypothetical protein